jgi:prepilin-type processing-associated H-X9-DG protein
MGVTFPGGSGGYLGEHGPSKYVSSLPYSPRLHPTNVNWTTHPQPAADGQNAPADSERPLFADVTVSNGNEPDQFAPFYFKDRLHSNHQKRPGVTRGGNVNFMDGHTSFLKPESMSMRTIYNRSITQPCFWF